MFTSVEQGYTAQSKAETGFSQGVPAMDISVNAMAALQTLPIKYGLIHRQCANVPENLNEALEYNGQIIILNTQNEARNVNLSIRAHIDPGSQSCTIELSNHTQIENLLPYDHGLNRLI